jgi:uncharacterized peroxidase-related enzyme
MEDYSRFPGWSERERAICDFAVKLTRRPGEMGAADVAALRRAGLDDGAIHDVVQVAALFNYYDRIADGLGIEMEPEWGAGPGSGLGGP